MADWKKKVDKAREQDEERARRQVEASRARDAAIKAQARAGAEKKLHEEIRQYKASHRCHICKWTPEPERVSWYSDTGYIISWPVGALSMCGKCGRWACSTHYYHGYCQRCGSKIK